MKALKIPLQFITGLIGGSVVAIASSLVSCTFVANIVAHGSEESFCQKPMGYLLSISIPFCALLGIWIVLKLTGEATKYLYLFLAAAILSVAGLLMRGFFYNLYIFIFYITISSLVLTVVANLFILKRGK